MTVLTPPGPPPAAVPSAKKAILTRTRIPGFAPMMGIPVPLSPSRAPPSTGLPPTPPVGICRSLNLNTPSPVLPEPSITLPVAPSPGINAEQILYVPSGVGDGVPPAPLSPPGFYHWAQMLSLHCR